MYRWTGGRAPALGGTKPEVCARLQRQGTRPNIALRYTEEYLLPRYRSDPNRYVSP